MGNSNGLTGEAQQLALKKQTIEDMLGTPETSYEDMMT